MSDMSIKKAAKAVSRILEGTGKKAEALRVILDAAVDIAESHHLAYNEDLEYYEFIRFVGPLVRSDIDEVFTEGED